MKRLCTVGVFIAVFAALPLTSHAQANRGSTTSGAFGQTTLGSTSGASPSGLGSGMTTGMSQNATQGGSGANNNMGQGQFGMATGATGMQQLQRGGQSGFVGLSAQNAQNFLSTQQGGPGGIGGRGGTQNFNQLTQLMAQARRNQFNQQQAQRNQQRGGQQAQSNFRVPMRLGFQPGTVSVQNFNGFGNRLKKIQGLSRVGPIEAILEERTAVLRGTVATEADRQLAEGLAMLEPEVLAVRNELVVAPTGTTGEGLPPPLTP